MYTATRRGLGLAYRLPAKRIAGRRFPTTLRSARSFSTAAPRRVYNPFGLPSTSQPPEGPPSTEATESTKNAQEVAEQEETKEVPGDGSGEGNGRSGPYGSALKRRTRNHKSSRDLPPVRLPTWFVDHNVTLRGERRTRKAGALELAGDEEEQTALTAMALHPDYIHESKSRTRDIEKTVQSLEPKLKKSLVGLLDKVSASQAAAEDAFAQPQPHRLNRHIYHEIHSFVSAALNLKYSESWPSNSFPASKSHLRLHSPVDGSENLLETVVEDVAEKLGADIVRLDAQDLAEITSEYMGEGRDAMSGSFWTMGYDAAQRFYPPPRAEDAEEMQEEAAEEEDEEDEYEPKDPRRIPRANQVAAVPVLSFTAGVGSMQDVLKKLAETAPGFGKNMGFRGNRGGSSGASQYGSMQVPDSNRWDDLKLTALLEVLVDANHFKWIQRENANQSASVETFQTSQAATEVPAPTIEVSESEESLIQQRDLSDTAKQAKTIVLIKGMKELSATPKGSLVLDKVFEAVERKRRVFSQGIVIVGTTASSELTPELSRSGVDALQQENPDSVYRTIVVTPNEAGPNGGLFYSEERRTTRELNARLLRDMVLRMSPQVDYILQMDDILKPEAWEGGELKELSTRLEDNLLSFDDVHRVVLTALGLQETDQPLAIHHIIKAMDILEESDDAKHEWVEAERQLQKGQDQQSQPTPYTANETRLKRLRKTCNTHEKVLLRGVVDPENIRVTWADVHAPSVTKEALQTLTTLSLTRPDAFKYGVLATDKISGALLYGPPGTGKTMLAKAVAKQSGATVLEVSGSDLYDMYVGEAEKNVRAVFSLAKKLSPCVVFIDEADAIFASRGSGTNRNSHRELINQFLREWDGMTETNAFIMLATNRPFDLDDAALRRLPRRILVDLPVEKDREAILAIHLKNEQLDPAISLADLAAKTPLFSGSDLKNLAVTAALTAVKEETEAAAAHTGNTPFVYAERRVLTPKHFDAALEEISASVSDDMSSLGAIRKFDERYGDKRGRKKRASYGFAVGEEGKGDTNKVRS